MSLAAPVLIMLLKPLAIQSCCVQLPVIVVSLGEDFGDFVIRVATWFKQDSSYEIVLFSFEISFYF